MTRKLTDRTLKICTRWRYTQEKTHARTCYSERLSKTALQSTMQVKQAEFKDGEVAHAQKKLQERSRLRR
jgi:hypothetical protein